MPKFNRQNRKKIDPRYFSEELLEEYSSEEHEKQMAARAKEAEAGMAQHGRDTELAIAREKAERSDFTGEQAVANKVWSSAACPKCKYGKSITQGYFKKNPAGKLIKVFRPGSSGAKQIQKGLDFMASVTESQLNEQTLTGGELFGKRARNKNAQYTKRGGKFFVNGKPANARQTRQLARRWPKEAAPTPAEKPGGVEGDPRWLAAVAAQKAAAQKSKDPRRAKLEAFCAKRGMSVGPDGRCTKAKVGGPGTASPPQAQAAAALDPKDFGVKNKLAAHLLKGKYGGGPGWRRDVEDAAAEYCAKNFHVDGKDSPYCRKFAFDQNHAWNKFLKAKYVADKEAEKKRDPKAYLAAQQKQIARSKAYLAQLQKT